MMELDGVMSYSKYVEKSTRFLYFPNQSIMTVALYNCIQNFKIIYAK